MATRQATIKALVNAIDSTRIAAKLEDVEREVAFLCSAMEWAIKAQSYMTTQDADTVLNLIRHRNYAQALQVLEAYH